MSTPSLPPDVSIVIVTFNSSAWVQRCLDSIPAALAGRSAEIIVVDNASADDSVEQVGRYPGVNLLTNQQNRGFAAAVNQGAAIARGRWVLLLNPDTESRPSALANLIEFAEHHPGHGLYGGRTVRHDGSTEPSSCWGLPTLWSTLCFAAGLSTLFPRTRWFDPESIGRWPRDTVREVGMITGCLLLVPTSLWRQLDGLDERYFVYGEDADLAARARALGLRPIITPDAVVEHAIGASSSDSGAKMTLLLAGKTTYIRTHWSGLKRSAGIGALVTGVAIRAYGARLTGRGRKWQAGWAARTRWRNGFPATVAPAPLRPDPGRPVHPTG